MAPSLHAAGARAAASSSAAGHAHDDPHAHHHDHHHAHDHGEPPAYACDCAAHRHAAAPVAQGAGPWTTLLPILACAVCPACLATYAKIFSVFGVGFGLRETQHTALLIVAIAASVAVSAWRSHRTKRAWPIAVASLGAGLLLLGHWAHGWHALEWLGMGVLLIGGVTEQLRLARARRSVGIVATAVEQSLGPAQRSVGRRDRRQGAHRSQRPVICTSTSRARMDLGAGADLGNVSTRSAMHSTTPHSLQTKCGWWSSLS